MIHQMTSTFFIEIPKYIDLTFIDHLKYRKSILKKYPIKLILEMIILPTYIYNNYHPFFDF